MSVGILHYLLAKDDVARSRDSVRELRVVGSWLLEEDVERDGLRSCGSQRIDELRVPGTLPAIELRRLTYGGRRVAGDRHDDDLRGRRQSAADREQQAEAQVLVDAQHARNEAQDDPGNCEAGGGQSGARTPRSDGIGSHC